jgi:hypothetical protein
MKPKILIALFALMFNAVVSFAVSTVTGFNPLAVLGVGSVLSCLPLTPTGALGMAVQKEIWMSSIVEGLFADNSFLSKAFNADEFVNAGKTVHIPNAGAASGVVKNRTEYPASVTAREDVNLDFNLDEFTTNPIKIPYADKVELSYNKRESVIKQDKSKLIEDVSNDMIYNWSPAVANTIKTTGAAIAAHTPSATGLRKAFTKADVKKAMTVFNKANVPAEGRYMLVDAEMYDQLIDSLTEKQIDVFNNLADIANGVVGKLYTFNIMMRSKAALYDTDVKAKLWTAEGATTDNAAVLAWHTNSVCRALGQTEMFESEKDPLYYADIYSFLVRAGGRPMRNGVEGLLAIVQDVAEAPAG